MKFSIATAFISALSKWINAFKINTDNMIDKEIFIRHGSSLIKMDLEDIVYIEARKNYVTLNTDKEKFTIHFPLNAIENQLPWTSFIRIHPSYIVNKSMIRAVEADSLHLKVGDTLKNFPVDNSVRDLLITEIKMMNR